MLQVNSSNIVHETIDGETVIINTLNGMYYIASDHASIIWNAIASGCDVGDIQDAFDKKGVFSRTSGVIAKFVELLAAEGLVVSLEGMRTASLDAITVNVALGAMIPVLTKHDDLHHLIELDPIHEVSPQLGWPFQEKQDHETNK